MSLKNRKPVLRNIMEPFKAMIVLSPSDDYINHSDIGCEYNSSVIDLSEPMKYVSSNCHSDIGCECNSSVIDLSEPMEYVSSNCSVVYSVPDLC